MRAIRLRTRANVGWRTRRHPHWGIVSLMLARYRVYEDIPTDQSEGSEELRACWEPQKRGSEMKWR